MNQHISAHLDLPFNVSETSPIRPCAMVARFVAALRQICSQPRGSSKSGRTSPQPAQVAQTRTAPLDSTVLPPSHLKCHEGRPPGHNRPDYGIKRDGAIPSDWSLPALEVHSRTSHALPLNARYGSAGWQHLSLRRPMP